jgi:multiple sugar transport system permease protein
MTAKVRSKLARYAGRGGIYLVMVIVAFYLLAPVAWMVIVSVTTQSEALSIPPHWIPKNPTLDNYSIFLHPDQSAGYTGADAVAALPRAMWNSAIVAIGVALANVVFGSMAAYSFARLKFRGSKVLLLAYIGSRMVPAVGIIIPLYIVLRNLGLLNNLFSLVVVETGETLPFTIWLLTSYFRKIPRDIEDAARIDRCNWFRAMIKVFLPIARPALVAAAILGFMSSWGSFLYPLLFTSGDEQTTLPVIVSSFATDVEINYGLLASSGVIAVIPPLILAFWFQRWIVQGVGAGAVKG